MAMQPVMLRLLRGYRIKVVHNKVQDMTLCIIYRNANSIFCVL